MRARAILSLISAAACANKCAHKKYAEFADIGTKGLSFLEGQVLDPLYKNFAGNDCPELRRLLNSDRPPCIPSTDKARCVVYTLLKRSNYFKRSELLLRLADYGYANCLLLRKLLSSTYVKSLVKQRGTPSTSEAHQEFCRATKHCRRAVQGLDDCLQKKVTELSTMELPQLAENGSGLDLAIYTIKTATKPKHETLSSAFAQLTNSWSNDAGKRGRLLPVVIEFARTVLQQKHIIATWQKELRTSIVEYVFSKNQRECYDLLFRGFPDHSRMSAVIIPYINATLNGNVSLCFMRSYLAYIKKYHLKIHDGAYNFFRKLLPVPAAFHAPETDWNSDKVRFNLISPRWLREMFENLHNNVALKPRQEELMRKYMKMLDYGMFICILKMLKVKKREELARFMLWHQNVRSARIYQQHLDRDLQRACTDKRYKNILRLLARYFKR